MHTKVSATSQPGRPARGSSMSAAAEAPASRAGATSGSDSSARRSAVGQRDRPGIDHGSRPASAPRRGSSRLTMCESCANQLVVARAIGGLLRHHRARQLGQLAIA